MSEFDWDDLKFFLAVARTRTISQASRELSVDHATVIRRIDNLEEKLGAKLLQRNSRGCNLTQTGERFLVSAQAIEMETRKASAGIVNTHPSISGTLRISSLEGFGNFFLAGRLPRFSAAHPGLTIEFMAIQQIVALSRREADVAVTLQPPAQGRFVSEKITDYLLFVYGAKSYLKRAPNIRTKQDLKKHAFTGYIDDLVFMRGLDYLNEIGYDRKAVLQSSSLHAQMEAARSGHGLCVLPRFIAIRYKELVPVLPAELFLRRSYWLVSHADTAETARVRAAVKFIRDETVAARDLFMGDTEE